MQVQPKTANVLAVSENLIKIDDWLKVSAATTLVLNQPVRGLNVITQNGTATNSNGNGKK